MSPKKHFWVDLLFGVQVIGGLLFFIPRTIRASTIAEGVSLGEPIAIMIFCLINLSLAIAARRLRPSRIANQIVWAFAMYVALIGLLMIATLSNPSFTWKSNDTQTIVIALTGGSAIVVGARMFFELPLTDPIVKGTVCIFMKAIPHVMWGLRIASEGSRGVPLISIVVGHFTIVIRLTQIALAIREEGWNRNRVGQLIGEGSAEFAWTYATYLWVTN